MKRVLLDQGLAPSAAEFLRASGWDAIHASEAGISRTDDEVVLDFALREGRVCVTLDHDFHSHLALLRSNGPSVILLRAEGLRGHEQAELIQTIWNHCEADIQAGAAVSASRTTIRVRRLPLR
jgi:predicted nuclease of predicted toxin-antitoxin system